LFIGVRARSGPPGINVPAGGRLALRKPDDDPLVDPLE
jgi:hypothetical protein